MQEAARYWYALFHPVVYLLGDLNAWIFFSITRLGITADQPIHLKRSYQKWKRRVRS